MISFLIPTKNEKHLWDTINSIHDNSRYSNEVLWENDDRGLGQRAIINKLAKQARFPIVAKVDAHCVFGPGFDEALMEDMDEKTVIAPNMYPLDDDLWTVNHHNPMNQFAFDSKFVMHHVENSKEVISETMCMQGSFFMCYKKFLFDANLVDESLGSWGSQAVELGIQTWTNGGRCITSKKTYYGHVFRHDEKDFPYKRDQKKIDETYDRIKRKYKDVDLGWLITKFNHPLDHDRTKHSHNNS
jgi:hypothetical protein